MRNADELDLKKEQKKQGHTDELLSFNFNEDRQCKYFFTSFDYACRHGCLNGIVTNRSPTIDVLAGIARSATTHVLIVS